MTGLHQPIPEIAPEAPSPSLLTSARDRTAQWGDLWRSGIAWPSTCQRPLVFPRCAIGVIDTDGDISVGTIERETGDTPTVLSFSEPFELYQPLSCNWVTDSHADRLAGLSESLADAHTSFALARALWHGDGLGLDTDQVTLQNCALPTNPDTTTGIESGVSLFDSFRETLTLAFALLMHAYAQATGGLGGAMIHLPITLLPWAVANNLIYREGALYRGPGGIIVVSDAGYPVNGDFSLQSVGVALGGSGDPDVENLDALDYIKLGPVSGTDSNGTPHYTGADSTFSYVYISGPVEYALGPITVLPEADAERRNFMRQNSYDVWGRRDAIFRFDCCSVFGIKVSDPVGVARD